MSKKKACILALLRILVSFGCFIVAKIVEGIVREVFNFLPSLAVVFLSTLLGIATFTFLLWLYLKLVEKRNLASIGLVPLGFRAVKQLVLGLLFGFFGFILIVLPLYLTKNYQLVFEGFDPISLFAGLIYFVGVGYSEELLTRGMIQEGFSFLGKVPALLITAVLFSAMHLFNPHVAFLALLNIILAGILFGCLLLVSKNLWLPIGMHITWNWVQGFVLGIPVSGTETSSVFSTVFSGQNEVITGGQFGTEGSVVCSVFLLLFILCTYLWKLRGDRRQSGEPVTA